MRWITLGELLAVVAVLLSALTFWANREDRQRDEAQAEASKTQAARATSVLALGGAVTDEGASLKIATLRDDQAIQGQTIRFPPALGIGAAETTGDARIDADWFSKSLLKLLKDQNNKGVIGDARLPVLIVTRFWAGGRVQEARAYYDIGYTVSEGGLLGGRRVTLTGLALIAEAGPADPGRRLEPLWRDRQPTISSSLKK